MNNTVFPIFRDKIKSCLGIDDFVVDMLEGECNREVAISSINKHPFLFHGLLSIITGILFPLKRLKTKVKFDGEDFIFVSCPDPAFRTKTIDLIADNLNYSIIYLPTFHVPTAIKYDRYFKSQGIRAFFPIIKLKYVLNAKRKLKGIIREIKKFRNDDDCIKVISVLSSYLIYSQLVNEYMSRFSSRKGKWILEHQKFFFMPTVAYLHSHSIPSTMLQHGIFFEPVYDFVPLLCDRVLCCSEREKKLYIENGTDEARIDVFGAPLQTLQLTKDANNTDKHYEMLIMMTMITDENIDITRNVLEFIKQNYSSVLVRMRPRSRKDDEALLAETLQGMTMSAVGTPISDDIISCDKIVSFSVDANIEAAKYHKPLVYIWALEDSHPAAELNCATKDNYKSEIKKLMENEFYSTFSKEQYVEILGETDIKILKERFTKYVKN